MFETESDFDNQFNDPPDNLGDLDAAFTEPFVARVLEMGHTYNEIFQETAPSIEEANYITSELDTEWGNLKGSPIKFTGNITIKDLDNEGEVRQVFLDGAHVVSNGFYIDCMDSPNGETYKVKHHLLVSFKDAYGIESEETKDSITGSLGDIYSSVIELDSASPERAKAWLSVSCPELIEEIDCRVLNESGEETDALLSLKNLDFNKYADLNDLFTRNCLNIYLQSIIEVDTVAPYSAALDGYARKADENLYTLYHFKADATLLYLNNISMQRSYNLDEDDNGWSLSAFISILGVNRNDESQNYVVPVDAIQKLQSIRTAYYTDNN